MRRWWRVGLSRTQLADLDRDARNMFGSHGPKARAAVLARAAAYGRRYHREAAWLSRVAACIGELVQPEVAPLQPINTSKEATNGQGEEKNLQQQASS